MRKDSWGRYIRPEPQPDPRYQQQLSFTFVPRECTPEEQQEWQEKELSPWAEKQLPIVALASLMQIFSVGAMLTAFYIIGQYAG